MDGDIIFQESMSSQSRAIQLATGSRYSHMGIVYYRDGEPYVLEAAGNVTLTGLDEWTSRGRGGHYVVKRLRQAEAILTTEVLGRMRAAAATLMGRPYDIYFEWDDGRIYCSELVWKVYERGASIELSPLKELEQFNLEDEVVAAKLGERYGNEVPLKEKVVSPADIYDSDMLVTVIATE